MKKAEKKREAKRKKRVEGTIRDEVKGIAIMSMANL